MENHNTKLIPREIREAEFPTARFLSEEEQTKYEESIKQFSGDAYDSLNIPREGSNILKVLWLNQQGIVTATLPELELALENGMQLQGGYQDGREVVLRSKVDSYEPNNYLAKTLAHKLKLRSFKHPYIIKGLRIQHSEAPEKINPYGLEFVTDNADVIEAKDFSHKNNCRRFRRINKDYSVEWDEQSNRILYTRDNGLSRLCLVRGSDVCSYSEPLAGSYNGGRVVVVS